MSGKESTSTAVVRAPEEGGGFLTPAGALFSTYPPAERAKVLGLMQGKATPLEEAVGKTIEVEHVVAHWVETVDEKTGEIKGFYRIVLGGTDGKAWQCASDGVRKSIGMIAHFYGRPPWSPALKLRVELIKTQRGRRTYALSPVAE
jgi:hypothetical protein